MEFTIITLGDLETFRATLTAIAMLFNPSNTTDFVGTSDVGLGGFAAIGLLIALTVALFKGVTTLKFELGELIIVVILYSALFVPKFDVVLEDYYTGQAAAVDDVPLGIALPGAFISGFTTQISETLSTAFKTASSPAFAMQENGFVYPLKLLNGLRNGSQTFAKKQPKISASVINVYKDCAFGRAGFDSGELARSNNPWEFLKRYIQNSSVTGITEIYTRAAPSGTIVTCQEAADLVSTDLDLLFEPGANPNIAPSTQNPNGVSQFEELVCANMKNVRTKNSGCPDYETYETSFHAISAASGESAKNFAMTTMLASSLKNAELCASGAVDAAKMASCMPMVTALEQFKEDAVGGATLFQKTMLNSMSVMLFLFYAFAPLVSVLMIALGAKGLKLLGSYFMFGIWTQSWLPFATILNFYIQQKVAYDSARFGVNSPELTAAGYQAFYESVSLNLGIASDLMAATPLITLALLSGSVFALTGVANRLSGRDYYDEKVNAPTAISNGPIAMNTPSFTGSAGKFTAVPGDAAAPTIGLSAATQSARSAARQTSINNSITTEESIAKATIEGYSQGRTREELMAYAKERGVDKTRGFKAAMEVITNADAARGSETGQAAVASNSETDGSRVFASGTGGGGVGTPTSKSAKKELTPEEKSSWLDKVKTKLNIDFQAGASAENVIQKQDATSTTQNNKASTGSSTQINSRSGDDHTATRKDAETVKQNIANAQSYARRVDKQDTSGSSAKLTSTAATQDAAIRSLTTTDALASQAILDPKGVLALLDRSPEVDRNLDLMRAEKVQNPAFAAAYRQQINGLRATDAASTLNSRGESALDDYAFMMTLSKEDPSSLVKLLEPVYSLSNTPITGNTEEAASRIEQKAGAALGESADAVPTASADGVKLAVEKGAEKGEGVKQNALNKTPKKPLVEGVPDPENIGQAYAFLGSREVSNAKQVQAEGVNYRNGLTASVGQNQNTVASNLEMYNLSAVGPHSASNYVTPTAKNEFSFAEMAQRVSTFVTKAAQEPFSVGLPGMLAEREQTLRYLDLQQAQASAALRDPKNSDPKSKGNGVLTQFLKTSNAMEEQIKNPLFLSPSAAGPSVLPNTKGAGERILKQDQEKNAANALAESLNRLNDPNNIK